MSYGLSHSLQFKPNSKDIYSWRTKKISLSWTPGVPTIWLQLASNMKQNDLNESVGFENIILGWFVAQALFIISLQYLVFDKEKI